MYIQIYIITFLLYFSQLPRGSPSFTLHPWVAPDSSTTRLSKGERPVLAPEKAAKAPVDRMAEPFSYRRAWRFDGLNHGNVKRWMGRLLVNVLVSG